MDVGTLAVKKVVDNTGVIYRSEEETCMLLRSLVCFVVLCFWFFCLNEEEGNDSVIYNILCRHVTHRGYECLFARRSRVNRVLLLVGYTGV